MCAVSKLRGCRAFVARSSSEPVQAGVDPLAVKRDYGERLLLHGGFNALLWYDVDQLEATVRQWLPELKAGGGYIFATDHSTPSNVFSSLSSLSLSSR